MVHAVFMSIFYPQSKWHLLLSEIRDILKQVEINKHTQRILVFLNRHRGENIRIVFEFNSDTEETVLRKISKHIRHFISGNPAVPSPVKIPITNFFADFPANEVHYNFFNERVLKYDAAGAVQDHLSQILVDFFADIHVNDKTVSALIKYLHQSILNGLPNTKERQAFISCLKKNSATINLEKTQYKNLFKKKPGVGEMLGKFGKATHEFFIETGDMESAHSEIMKIIQLQLGEIPTQMSSKISEPLKILCN